MEDFIHIYNLDEGDLADLLSKYSQRIEIKPGLCRVESIEDDCMSFLARESLIGNKLMTLNNSSGPS